MEMVFKHFMIILLHETKLETVRYLISLHIDIVKVLSELVVVDDFAFSAVSEPHSSCIRSLWGLCLVESTST